MDAIHNFRDFGGYKTRDGLTVKKGMIYRSGSIHNASDDDLKRLSSLEIKTICDLRTHKERKSKPDRILRDSAVRNFHFPIKVKKHDESGFVSQLFSLLFGDGRTLNFHEVTQEIYRELATDFRTEFSDIVKLAAESGNLPMLIHCTAGKDRTGYACSLIQLMLGMPVELVLHDYLLSNEHLHQLKIEMLKKLRIFSFFGVPTRKFLPLFDARREYLEASMNQMNQDYGTLENYIRHGLGITDEDRLRLSRLLLEKS